MILSDLRTYLRERGQSSLQDIALHFDTDPDALRGMLDHWIRKGKVSRMTNASCASGGCTQCDPAAVEIYAWGKGQQQTGQITLVRDLGCTSSRE